MKEYDYEGEGSVISSIDNCSYNESNDDLEFLNDLGSKFTTLAEVCGFTQTQPMPQADPKVTVNTVEKTSTVTVNTVETTPTTTAFTAVSSNHMTSTDQPSPVEITVKSPLVQTAPSQGMVVQEPVYYGFNQPMQNNVLLSGDGFGQGVYIINGNPEADRHLTQGNSHTLAHLASGQQVIIGDSIPYSQIGPQSPVMINQGFGEFNTGVIQNLSPTTNLVMMPQQQLHGTGSLQMVQVPMGSVVSGESGQGRVNLQDGSVSGGMVLVGGQNHRPMSPQQFYPISSQELSGPVHMNQRAIDGSFYNAQNDGQGEVRILESLVNGSNVLVGGQGAQNLVSMPQIANGQVNSQLLLSGPFSNASNIVSGEGGESRLLVSGSSIPEGAINGGSLMVAGPGQYPVSMSAGNPNLVSMSQVANGQVNNSQLLVGGPFSNVQNIVAGEGGQSRLMVNGSIQRPLVMSTGAPSSAGKANKQLFRSTASKVLTSMVMTPKSRGLVTSRHLKE